MAQDIEDAVTALESEGVKHIFWLTLRAARHPYLTMNDGIEARRRATTTSRSSTGMSTRAVIRTGSRATACT